MKNPTLEQIRKTVVDALVAKYGYCGCADGPNFALLNSGGDGEDFQISIKDQSAIDAEKTTTQKAA